VDQSDQTSAHLVELGRNTDLFQNGKFLSITDIIHLYSSCILLYINGTQPFLSHTFFHKGVMGCFGHEQFLFSSSFIF